MGRYTIGNEYVFFQIKIEQGNERFGSAYCPWLGDKIDSFKSVVLTCFTEHDVTNGWSNVKDCKGYIFKDKEEKLWANQFPTASYGQLDDSADGHVRRFFTEVQTTRDEVGAKRWLKSPDGLIYEDQFWNPYVSAQRLLSTCHLGKKHVPEHADAIQEYIVYLDNKLNELGFMHVMESISEKHPNFIVPRVKKIEAQVVS